MKLYEIDDALAALVNEDGEIADFEAFEALQMEREQKIENVACWYKNLLSDAAALKAEEQALAERRKSAESKAEWLKGYLARALDGQKFETARVKCGWRKSTAVEYTVDEATFIEWAREARNDLLSYKPPVPDKKAIKAAIEAGEEILLAGMVERNNITIK